MDQSPFELRILGPTELRGTRPDQDDANVRPPKRLALLAYLALETADGFRRRDQIVALFWPDLGQEAARTQLRKALFAFRESLGSESVISRGESEVRLDPAIIWCDAVALGQYVREERWTEALALYRGDLLDGLFPEGVAQEFEEWLGGRRKTLREQAAVAAWECARLEETRGDRKAASVMARRALDLTPDDESGVRRLMELLDRHGDRGGALRVYADWQARLQAEFGVEPAPETRKVARRIQAARKGESHETPPTQQVPAYRPPGASVQAESAADHAGASAIPAAQGEARKHRLVRLGSAVVAIGLLSWLGFIGWTRIVAAVPPESVAVLPLHAIGDPSLSTAAERIGEELTNALIESKDLVVRSTSRATDAVREGGDVDRIGRRLAVAYVVDGGVQTSGGRLRITLRLIRASDGVALWAGNSDFDNAALTTTAQTVARQIATEIRAKQRAAR